MSHTEERAEGRSGLAHLVFCPYLPVTDRLEFAGWLLGPLDTFEEEWSDSRLREIAEAFLAKFVDVEGNPVRRPSLVAAKDGGLEGVPPSDSERQALQLALDFEVLDGNPPGPTKGTIQNLQVATTDNSDLFIWPIHLENGAVTPSRGFLRRTHVGGWTVFDEDLKIQAPLELFLPTPRRLDAQMLEAAYNIFIGELPNASRRKQSKRVKTATGWLAKAWRNTPSIGAEERVVMLKTGFEALTGKSNKYECACALRRLFERLGAKGSTDEETTHLLWSPSEEERHARQGRSLTDIEDWFIAFSNARNEIIHEGHSPELHYERSGSAYSGHFFHTAERLLREAIRVSLEELGFPDMWRERGWREIRNAFQKAVADQAQD